jgi:CRISP-associated protein Cas1
MSTLFIDRRGADVDAEGDTVVVRAEGERKGTVPLKPLERVVVKGSARLTTRLLTKLAEHGIGLLVLGGRTHKPGATLIGRPSSDTTLRLAQASLLTDELSRAAIAQVLVLGKVKGQLEFLREAEATRGRSIDFDRGIEALTRALSEVAAPNPARPRLRGLEGAAAAAYFAAYGSLFPASLAFTGRNRRPPRDPVNACLSLGYTLLHFDAVREAATVGLDPLIGVYHDILAGRESLACDLAEPFRPAVDRFVVRLFAEGELRPEHFSTTKDGCLMGKTARHNFYAAYELAAVSHRRALARLSRDLAEVIRAGGPRAAIARLEPGRKENDSDAAQEHLDHRL